MGRKEKDDFIWGHLELPEPLRQAGGDVQKARDRDSSHWLLLDVHLPTQEYCSRTFPISFVLLSFGPVGCGVCFPTGLFPSSIIACHYSSRLRNSFSSPLLPPATAPCLCSYLQGSHPPLLKLTTGSVILASNPTWLNPVVKSWSHLTWFLSCFDKVDHDFSLFFI